MKILAAEFSSAQRSVAIWADGAVRGSACETTARVTGAIGLVEQALAQAGLEREAIECLAIGRGPGSYAGIRAAIALAQGWQLARPVQILAFGSLECLAAEARSQGWRGRVNFVVDAQRQELYLAQYEISAENCRETIPLKLAPLAEVRTLADAGEIIAGPEVKQWFPAGRELFPNATTLAQLAATRTDFIPGEKLEPIYLRETNFVKAPPSVNYS